MAVCDPCSKNKKFLSKDAKEKFRVCDLCDTKLDNIRLRNQYDKFIQIKEDKVKLMETILKKRKEQKKELKKDFDELQAKLNLEVKDYEKKYVLDQENNKRFISSIDQLKIELAAFK